jgi:pectate lyase
MKNSPTAMATAVAFLTATALATTALAGSAQAAPSPQDDRDLGRETLAADDGWAAAEGGTTGGSDATDENVFTVGTWHELQAAR